MGGEREPCVRCAPLVAELQAQVAELRAQVRDLTAQVRELSAQLKRNSSNSSMPPSADPPWIKPNPKPPTGRRPGGQPGHEGHTRAPFSAEEVDEVVRCAPGRCRGCRRPLGAGRAERVLAHQVVEIPRVAARVTEYRLEQHRCGRCGVLTWGELPAEAQGSVAGPRFQAVASVLSGRYRTSRREVEQALVALFGEKARVSLGTVSQMEARTSEALAAVHAEARAAVGRARIVNADETSWPVRGRKGWLWDAVTRRLALFAIDPERSEAAFRRLLGEFRGILGTDRWSAYHAHPPTRRQCCWAHLRRNFKAIEERGGEGAEVGRAGLGTVEAVFALWDRFRSGEITRSTLRSEVSPIRMSLRWRLEEGAACPDRKAAALCKDLLGRWTSLWTFTRREGVEPTNNAAERAIRKAVLWRKGSFGSTSGRGSRFAERMLTVSESLRLQGRSVLDFVEAAIRAHRTGSPRPSLLRVSAS